MSTEIIEEPIVRPKHKKPDPQEEQKNKRQPPYNVILLNDDFHSFEYVIAMCGKIFGYPVEKGIAIALEVHNSGRCIVWSGSLELAELKQEQIHAHGADPDIPKCQGSMTAEIEPAT